MAPIRPPQLVPHDDILPCILVMVMITMMGMVVVVVVMTMMLCLPPPPHTHIPQVSSYECEADRIRALDSLPPGLRRANPQMTRDHYLKQRSQPGFMMRTAQVGANPGS